MESKGLLIGGLLPALLFGIAGLLQKSASRFSPGMGPYLLCIGLGVMVVGALATLVSTGRNISLQSGLLSMTIGLSWSAGMALVAVGITRYATPLAKLAPLYNLNTLVVVVLALVIFSEAREVAVTRLMLGTLLIIGGGLLVARA